jgi:Lon-like protease
VIADMIDTPDDARGRAVAATGTIDAEGRVGEVGGVPEKAVAAARAGADVFIVPTDELDEADDTEDDLTVFGADDLPQALSVLRSTG